MLHITVMPTVDVLILQGHLSGHVFTVISMAGSGVRDAIPWFQPLSSTNKSRTARGQVAGSEHGLEEHGAGG